MTLVLYTGPDGQASREIGLATGRGDLLETGAVYDVPPELAARLVGGGEAEDGLEQAGGAFFERVNDLDDLTLEQLQQIARDRRVKGRTKMDRAQLLAALRGEQPGADEGGDGDEGDGGDA